jgi:hypothetical protein
VPNGRPGDHPYTDIIVHGREVFSAEVTRLAKEIDGLGDDRASELLANLLSRMSPELGHPSNRKLLTDELEKNLRALLELTIEARKSRIGG